MSTSNSTNTNHPNLKQFALWLLGSTLAVGVLSIIAVKLPPDFKKLGMFYVVFGALSGLVMGRIWQEIASGFSKAIIPLGALIIVAGGVNIGWLSYQDYAAHKQIIARENPEQLAALNIIEQISQLDEESMQKYEEARREFEPKFEDYLSMRVSPLGARMTGYGPLFWGGELCLAAALGAFLLGRSQLPTPSSSDA